MEQLINLYQLSKTLRFELRPVGCDGKELSQEEAIDRFKKIIDQDKKIKEAYDALKPIMDKIHEEVITCGLESEKAKDIDFTKYYEAYKNKADKADRDEEGLRNAIVKEFDNAVSFIVQDAKSIRSKKYKKGIQLQNSKEIKDKKEVTVSCLENSNIFKYIEEKLVEYVEKYDLDKNKLPEYQKHLETFKSFTGYFDGYNTNRKNYYASTGESTAVATRIVHENLPKFCDNLITFSEIKTRTNKKEEIVEISNKDDYLGAYSYLKAKERSLKIRDAKSGKDVNATPISEAILSLDNFKNCLSQGGIEEYNRIIGHYNSLINLYNQAREGEDKFTKLSPLKTLYKQIGCGKRKLLFEAIENDIQLKEKLIECAEKGQKYFVENTDEKEITIYSLTHWLKNTDSWDGVYWSKQTIGVISNNYLANWYAVQSKIEEGLKERGTDFKSLCSSVASFKKDRQEQFKFHDAVELSSLFEIIDENCDVNDFFKESILEEYKDKISFTENPSKVLIALVCYDIEQYAESFCAKFKAVLEVEDYKSDAYIKLIKEWLDDAVAIVRRVKNFYVREDKVKGNPVNAELLEIINSLINAEDINWTKSYDLVRNYLTKKPQDEAKENKLKLNFDHSKLLGGFVDSYSDSDNATQYGAYLFRKKVEGFDEDVYDYYLGISKKTKLFRCHLQNKITTSDKSEFERLEYYQAKATTYFDNKYSENKEKLISSLEILVNHVKDCSLRYLKTNNRETINNILTSKLGLTKKLQKELPTLDDNSFVGKIEENIVSQASAILKRNKDNEITPIAIVERVSKKELFKEVLDNTELIEEVNETIEDLKRTLETFKSKTPGLSVIIDCDYVGIAGFVKIIGDMQAFANANKVLIRSLISSMLVKQNGMLHKGTYHCLKYQIRI